MYRKILWRLSKALKLKNEDLAEGIDLVEIHLKRNLTKKLNAIDSTKNEYKKSHQYSINDVSPIIKLNAKQVKVKPGVKNLSWTITPREIEKESKTRNKNIYSQSIKNSSCLVIDNKKKRIANLDMSNMSIPWLDLRDRGISNSVLINNNRVYNERVMNRSSSRISKSKSPVS